MDGSDAAVASAFRLHGDGRVADAEVLCRDVLRSEPGHAEACHLLGLITHQAGRDEEAIDLLRRAVGGDPEAAVYRTNLAAVLGRTGRTEEAAAQLFQAARLRPDHPETLNNLGAALETLGHFAEAQQALERALRLRPAYAEAHSNLGNVLSKLRRPEEAVAAYQRAIAIRPDYAKAHQNLAEVLQDQGRTAESLVCFRRAVELLPESPAAHSDLLYTLHYQSGLDPQAVFDEHREWERRHAPVSQRAGTGRRGCDVEGRRVRVGYVSADFRDHAVARFILPVLAHHDRGRFETYCYSDVSRPDAMTQKFRDVSSVWRDVARLRDAQFAEQVRADKIDVLVDLTGHIAKNRLPAFALRLAPVQMAYIGYPGSTGLRAIDYRITDALTDPPGMTERWHTETLLRLPGCAWCYDPAPEAELPPVPPLPAEANGFITFGSLNRLAKLTEESIRLCARVLRAVPASRVLVLASGGEANITARAVLERGGVPGDRLLLVDRCPRRRYLELAGRIDIALDTFPYHGMTTTCDMLWMGVPTVTLVGATTVSRVGLSILAAAGLDDLAAASPEQFVDVAAGLARDRAALASLRAGLRERVSRSPLADGTRVAGALEAAYLAACRAAATSHG